MFLFILISLLLLLWPPLLLRILWLFLFIMVVVLIHFLCCLCYCLCCSECRVLYITDIQNSYFILVTLSTINRLIKLPDAPRVADGDERCQEDLQVSRSVWFVRDEDLLDPVASLHCLRQNTQESVPAVLPRPDHQWGTGVWGLGRRLR